MRHALAALLVFLFAGSAQAEWSVDAMNQQIDQTSFVVNHNCSGTLIDKKSGYILTANHCLAGQFENVDRDEIDKDGKISKATIRIVRPGTVSQLIFSDANETQRTQYVYKVKATDPDLDLGLIQVVSKLPNTIEAPIACKYPRRGDTVYAVGNPFVVLYATVTKGIVASTDRSYRILGIDGNTQDGEEQPGDNALMQITAPIEGGNSGGAAYNERGEIIGVNVRGSRINETLAFSVPLKDIRKFLAANGVTLPECE